MFSVALTAVGVFQIAMQTASKSGKVALTFAKNAGDSAQHSPPFLLNHLDKFIGQSLAYVISGNMRKRNAGSR